jgi:hypothetical protein
MCAYDRTTRMTGTASVKRSDAVWTTVSEFMT